MIQLKNDIEYLLYAVIPAKAGIQNEFYRRLDSRFRGNDGLALNAYPE
ncbi:MAG: hypothetical protein HYS58_02455 [Elusimicrobia bacterium]|nr:hypothetical protein [Elusimicrobiota bacterium]